MKLEQQGSFKAIGSRFTQLKGQHVAAKAWAVEAAHTFKETLAYVYANPNPARSSATNYLRSRLDDDDDHLIDHLQITLEVTAHGVIVTVGMEPGESEMISLVQEYGVTIEVTEKMRGFLGANGMPLKATTKAIRVPARHPWRKAWEKSQPVAVSALLAHL